MEGEEGCDKGDLKQDCWRGIWGMREDWRPRETGTERQGASEKGKDRHRGGQRAREMTTNSDYPSDLILRNPLFRFPFFLKIIFVYFWLCWVSLAACGLSLAVASGGYSLVVCGLLIGVTSLVENGL